MIVDAHAHVTREAYGDVDRLVAALDRAGSAVAWLVPGGMIDVRRMTRHVLGALPIAPGGVPNDVVDAAIDRYPDRLLGLTCVDPADGRPTLEILESGVRRGRVGLKLAPAVHRFDFGNATVHDLAALCGDLDVPLYSHVTFAPGSSTAAFERLAAAFPRTRFILGHMGMPPADDEAIAVAERRENVTLETSGGATISIQMAVERLGASRLMYGSEFPLHHPVSELAKIRLLHDAEYEQITTRTAWEVLGRRPAIASPGAEERTEE